MFYQFLTLLLLSMHYATYPPTWGRGLDKRAALYSAIVMIAMGRLIDTLIYLCMSHGIFSYLIWVLGVIGIYLYIYRYQVIRDANMMALWKMQRASQIRMNKFPTKASQSPRLEDNQWRIKRSRITLFDTNIDLIQMTTLAQMDHNFMSESKS